MSLTSLIVLMFFAGVAGGIINYIFAKQATKAVNKPNKIHSILIGIGATLLVPLFLEFAQSKLLDGIQAGFPCKQTVQTTAVLHKSAIAQPSRTDSTASVGELKPSAETEKVIEAAPPLKNYLLYLAYCFLAAVAGPRFINSVMDSLLKEKEIERLSEENKEIIDQKHTAEKIIHHRDQVNTQMAMAEEQEAIQETANPEVLIGNARPKIGEITVPDDPQKGRFGGLRERNGRKLCAEVQNAVPRLYKVKLWVESTDPDNPLDADVVYYLHNTFRPSVFTIKVEEFEAGKAAVEPKMAWGSFTVGAVTDNGKTLLEYDLALNTDFPLGFRIS